MLIKWLGHACFFCEGDGVRLLNDPFDKDMGFPLPAEEADIVTVSHDHYDHNDVEIVPGQPVVVREPGVHVVNGFKIEGHSVFHDEERGAKRGKNTVFLWEMEGVRVCHMGDLGHVLETSDIQALGRVDLVMIPVGGIYTVNPEGALEVVKQLSPKIVIPMHYHSPAMPMLEQVDKFTRYFSRVRYEKRLLIAGENLPREQEVVVLDYLA